MKYLKILFIRSQSEFVREWKSLFELEEEFKA